MAGERLTPEAFKAVFKQRGWTGKSLAARWEVTEAWVSKVVNNPQRAAHWDDAVRGLPIKENRIIVNLALASELTIVQYSSIETHHRGNAMRTSTLQSLGMTGSACPVTNVRAPNVSRSFGDFSISYCGRSSDYGCDTTAIVLDGRVFLILNGNHAEQLCIAASEEGIQGCVDYFVDNIDQANGHSEHLMATGVVSDPFELLGTALRVMGQSNIDRIAQAVA